MNAAGIEAVPDKAPLLTFGRFRLDTARGLLYRDDAPLAPGGRALELLLVLTQRAGEVLGHRELERAIWAQEVDASNLRAQVVRLRRALDDGAEGRHYIANVAGRGYAFVGPIERISA
ncbi:winged helix-turn-helix domain-containing protein [Massilia sp. IC2-477]|uniref:winged helix-turn-helix domain-containing protein n=1 Tax=Massilia sp. IC2-477 TaxID=2887198 RepID=UPI001D0F6C78|nr:winged helix-turn-helix domain-containing protein [Massilia sp. IC2-477]MCC2957567.1 winged helix-turn-helix domain-containing protein [Massilia sp. IC2-477]